MKFGKNVQPTKEIFSLEFEPGVVFGGAARTKNFEINKKDQAHAFTCPKQGQSTLFSIL